VEAILRFIMIPSGILEEDKDDRDNEATLMAKYFYQSCMNMAAIEQVSDSPLRRVIAELGGWPVTDPEKWAQDENEGRVPSLERVAGVIKRNFTIGVLIEEWIGPDDKNSKKHIIQVSE